MNNHIFKFKYTLALFLLGFAINVAGQVSPPASMYFLNEYLYNPALAGKMEGIAAAVSYKNNLTGSNGQTQSNTISAEYGKDKAGFGLQYASDKDGILNYNRIGATYAYHLQTSQTGGLSFGLSAIVSSLKLDATQIVGDLDDDLIKQIDQEGYNFDVDLGVNYTAGNLTIGTVLPNIRNIVNDDEIKGYNYSKYYFSAAYKITKGNITYVPKVLYRGLYDTDGVFDAGLNLQFSENAFNLMGIYHSNNNISMGVGFKAIQQLNVQLAYSLPINNNIRKYTYGAVEIGIKANLFK